MEDMTINEAYNVIRGCGSYQEHLHCANQNKNQFMIFQMPSHTSPVSFNTVIFTLQLKTITTITNFTLYNNAAVLPTYVWDYNDWVIIVVWGKENDSMPKLLK